MAAADGPGGRRGGGRTEPQRAERERAGRSGRGERDRSEGRHSESRRSEETSGSDLGSRVLVAVPALIFAVVIIVEGGLVFAAGAILLGLVGLHELYSMMRRVRPVKLAGFLALIALVLAAHYGGQFEMVLVLAAAFPVTFFLALARRPQENVSWAIAATLLGVAWIGLALAHAVLLRDLPHGEALLADVLVGTFLGDTAAYFGGRAWGRRPLAPSISPNKTLEGLVLGIAGGTLAFWLFAISYQDWFRGQDALLIGFCVALAAPLGDLFESLLKRDLDAKDAGRIFGAHGGVIDRLDALFFSVVVAYYLSVAVLGPT